jgi:hypothetical protein
MRKFSPKQKVKTMPKLQGSQVKIDTVVIGSLAHRVPVQRGPRATLCGRDVEQAKLVAKAQEAAGLAPLGPTEMRLNCRDTEPGFRQMAEREGTVELPRKASF